MIIDRHDVKATLQRFGFSDIDLEVDFSVPGSIILDRGWSTHLQGSLSVKDPGVNIPSNARYRLLLHLLQRTGDISFLSDLDYLLADGDTTDVDALLATGTSTAVIDTMIADGNYNSPPVSASSRRLTPYITDIVATRARWTLTLQSDEWMFQDVLQWGTNVSEPEPLEIEGTTAVGMAAIAFSSIKRWPEAGPPLPIVHLDEIRSFESRATTVEPGQSLMSPVYDALAALHQKLYSPGDGTVVVRDYPYTLPGTYQVSDDRGNLIDWSNEVSLVPTAMYQFSGTNDDPETPYIASSYTVPTTVDHWRLIEIDALWPEPPVGYKPLFWNHLQPWTDRFALLENPNKVVAVNNYHSIPGTTLALTQPGKSPANHIVDSVTWELGGSWQSTITY